MEKLTGMWGVGEDDTKGKVSLITTSIHSMKKVWNPCKITSFFHLQTWENLRSSDQEEY